MKEKLKAYLLGKTEDPPPTNVGVDGTMIREVLDEKQAAILTAVNGALDDKLAEFKPMLESFKAKAEDDEKEKEEKEAIARINASRKSRGLKPLVAEDEDGDEDKKEAPGRHDKKSKAGDDEDYKKKDDDKEARLKNLEGKIDGILKGIKESGLVTNDPLAAAVGDGGEGQTQMLKTSGRQIPVEKSWGWVQNTAPSMRAGIRRNGTYEEVAEFDILTAKVAEELTKEGIPEPKNLLS